MPTNRKMLHVYATDEEAEWIKQQAKRHNTTVSKFLLSLVPGINRIQALELPPDPFFDLNNPRFRKDWDFLTTKERQSKIKAWRAKRRSRCT